MNELVVSGFIRQEGVELVKGKTVDLEVPAHAEMIIEGYVVPGDERMEGPFGDHTGYYSVPDMYPVFHVTCITHRRNPIYPTIIVGRPPMEDYYMGKVTERVFLPIIQMVVRFTGDELMDRCTTCLSRGMGMGYPLDRYSR